MKTRFLILAALLAGAAAFAAITPNISASGNVAVLTCTADGTPPLSFQWFKGSTPISGATSAQLTVSLTTAAVYRCQVSNSAGSVSSGTVRISTTATDSAADLTLTKKTK